MELRYQLGIATLMLFLLFGPIFVRKTIRVCSDFEYENNDFWGFNKNWKEIFQLVTRLFLY